MKSSVDGPNQCLNRHLAEDVLSKAHSKIKEEQRKVSKADLSFIREWAQIHRGEGLIRRGGEAELCEAIAVVGRALELVTGGIRLRCTQLIAIYLFLDPTIEKGLLGEIATGEGKSAIVAVVAAVRALSCQRVDIITSAYPLAIRDSEEFSTFYGALGLQVSNICDSKSEDPKVRRQRYCSQTGPVDVIYGEAGSFERDILLTTFYGSVDKDMDIISGRDSGAKRCAIVDEVDSMLLDSANTVLYLSHSISTLHSLEEIFITIWQLVNHPDMDLDSAAGRTTATEFVLKYVTEQIFGKKTDADGPSHEPTLLIPSYSSPCGTDMQAFVKRRLPIWIQSAFDAKWMHVDDNFILAPDQENLVTVMDKATGTELATTRWSNGLHQFLQLRFTQRLPPESLKAVFMSNVEYFKRYQSNLVGMPGTLGSKMETTLLEAVFNINVFQLPRHKTEGFARAPDTVCRTLQEWQNFVCESVMTLSMQGRATLIICESIQAVRILKEVFVESFPKLDTLIRSRDKISRRLNPSDLVLATNLAGRGTDIGLSDAVVANGGLHVIVAYMPSNIRIESQAFGRAARKGQPGSGCFIVYDPQGRSVDVQKRMRDDAELNRLQHFMKNQMPAIELEESLLSKFKELSAEVRDSLSKEGCLFVDAQVLSLTNHWALWLDSQSDAIARLEKANVLLSFGEFKRAILSLTKLTDIFKVVVEPPELAKLGLKYFSAEKWTEALQCFEKASSDNFYSLYQYLSEVCTFKRDRGSGSTFEAKKKLAEGLAKSVGLLSTKAVAMLKAASAPAIIAESRRAEGDATAPNVFLESAKEKHNIWQLMISSIEKAIPSPVMVSDFNVYLSEKDAGLFLASLEEEGLVLQKQILRDKIPSKPQDLYSLLPPPFRYECYSSSIWKSLREGDIEFRTAALPSLDYFMSKGFVASSGASQFVIKPDGMKFNTLEETRSHYLATGITFPLTDAFTQIVEQGKTYFFLKTEPMLLSELGIQFPTRAEAVACLVGALQNSGIISRRRCCDSLLSYEDAESRTKRIKVKATALIQQGTLKPHGKGCNTDDVSTQLAEALRRRMGSLTQYPDDETNIGLIRIADNFTDTAPPFVLSEFAEIGCEWQLSISKSPPKWYEIAAVALLGIVQIGLGTVLCVLGLPMLGNFLISTGCDDLIFAVECAIKGEFSWEAYWEHKKSSMVTSAITSVVGSFATFAGRLKRFGTVSKAFRVQSEAQRLTAAAKKMGQTISVTKVVAKRITTNTVTTALSGAAAQGVDKLVSTTVDCDAINSRIDDSVRDYFDVVPLMRKVVFSCRAAQHSTPMGEAEAIEKGDLRARELISEHVQRSIAHMPTNKALQTCMQYAKPAVQGALKGLAGRAAVFAKAGNVVMKGVDSTLGVAELMSFISTFFSNLCSDLETGVQKDSRSDVKEDLSLSWLADFEKKARLSISKELKEVVRAKISSAVVGPIVKGLADKALGKVFVKLFPQLHATNKKIEDFAADEGAMDAVLNPRDAKPRHCDRMAYHVLRGREVSIANLSRSQREAIRITNITEGDGGANMSLERLIAEYGAGVKLYIRMARDQSGVETSKFVAVRPTRRDYRKAIEAGKPASLTEQRALAKLHRCTLTDADDSGIVTVTTEDSKTFQIKRTQREDGVGHATLVVDGVEYALPARNSDKSGCYYLSMLVGLEMVRNRQGVREANASVTSEHLKEARIRTADAVMQDPTLKLQMRDFGASHSLTMVACMVMGVKNTNLRDKLSHVDKFDDKKYVVKAKHKDVENVFNNIDAVSAIGRRPGFRAKAYAPGVRDTLKRGQMDYAHTIPFAGFRPIIEDFIKNTCTKMLGLQKACQITEKCLTNIVGKDASHAVCTLHASLTKNTLTEATARQAIRELVVDVNSSPLNLRPGDRSSNRSIQDNHDYSTSTSTVPFTSGRKRIQLPEGKLILEKEISSTTKFHEQLLKEEHSDFLQGKVTTVPIVDQDAIEFNAGSTGISNREALNAIVSHAQRNGLTAVFFKSSDQNTPFYQDIKRSNGTHTRVNVTYAFV